MKTIEAFIRQHPVLACVIICVPTASGAAFLTYAFTLAAALWLVFALVAAASGRKSNHPQ